MLQNGGHGASEIAKSFKSQLYDRGLLLLSRPAKKTEYCMIKDMNMKRRLFEMSIKRASWTLLREWRAQQLCNVATSVKSAVGKKYSSNERNSKLRRSVLSYFMRRCTYQYGGMRLRSSLGNPWQTHIWWYGFWTWSTWWYGSLLAHMQQRF